LIVMKFGGSSVASAERIRCVGDIVRDHAPRGPVVVVSALGGVTDLLQQAVEAARGDDLDVLDPILADLERRHRWALSGSVESPRPRHDLSLELDRQFEDLRQRLRSVRILGEGTPRAVDGLLATGELIAARIVAAAFEDRGLPAEAIDARRVMITNDRYGCAEPDIAAVRARCDSTLTACVADGRIPVVGGFVGATPAGETTTLGRGGSDTSASVLGLALEVEEIQIWTDVDGLLTADPRRVPTARRLERISFAEAAELAFHGARVLHPSSIAPAVRHQIPVRVLNSHRPDVPGTLVLGDPGIGDEASLSSLASRGDVGVVRMTTPHMRVVPGFASRMLAAASEIGLAPHLVLAGDVTLALVVPGPVDASAVEMRVGGDADLEVLEGRAIICCVGSQLAQSGSRSRVLEALGRWDPDVLVLGASGISVSAVLEQRRLGDALQSLHRQFFERSESA
jgi:aspartate kinase